MSNELPSVSVLIPTRPGQAIIKAVIAARQLDYPPTQLEILVARGKQPAIQRNAALKMARGGLIYFIDDDSQPLPGTLRRGVSHFADPSVQMVGGPNLCPTEAPPLEQIFAVTLAAWLAFGPSRARYEQVGRLRATSEKELILCNLLARRDAIMELGGFDESLYPNEENALMDDLQRRGGKLLYDPDFFVYRRPRPTLRAFVKMLFNYGRGRAEQFRLHPTLGSALNFVPPLFCLYLLLLPLLLKIGPIKGETLGIKVFDWVSVPHMISMEIQVAWLPLLLYAIAVGIQTIYSSFRHGIARSVLAVPFVVLTHLIYGLGFWRGLVTRVATRRPAAADSVLIERVELNAGN